MKNLSLSALIFIGMILGVLTGIVLGDHAAVFAVVGDAFVGLLQMTVLPFITVALVASIGRLSVREAGRFGKFAGSFLLISLGLTLGAIVLLPLSLPGRESASFFSTGSLEEPASIDFLRLFIPSNPFSSLANSVVPAIVLFCIAIGLAIMTMERKRELLDQLDVLASALGKINQALVKITPVGIFAIVASAAGTMELEELARLEAYLVLFSTGALVIGYGALLPIAAALTPFSYGQLFRASRAPVLTAFATGKVFIVLPMLVAANEELFRHEESDGEQPVSAARAVIPLIYPIPHAGKLLALLFVPFAAWFIDESVALSQYPALLGGGLLSMFGSPLAAISFLLDQLRLPADMFQLFVVSGVLASRVGDLLGVIHLLFVSVLTGCALTGRLHVKPQKLFPVLISVLILGAAATGANRIYLASSMDDEYDKDQVVRNMHSALHASTDAVIHRTQPPAPLTPSDQSLLDRIADTGVLRVGYHRDNLPWSFFNARDELVGYDIDMAHLLAQHLQCRIEFIPFEFLSLPEQLQAGAFDVAMSGVTMLPARLQQMRFTEPYTQITAGLLVRDHRRKEFEERMAAKNFRGIRAAVGRVSDAAPIARALLPGVDLVTLPILVGYLESGGAEADLMLWTAEAGSAWTLLFPEFSVVLVRPLFRAPVGYAVSRRNEAFAQYLSSWIQFTIAGGYTQRLYDHWILGRNLDQKSPRWSVVRNVLGWDRR